MGDALPSNSFSFSGGRGHRSCALERSDITGMYSSFPPVVCWLRQNRASLKTWRRKQPQNVSGISLVRIQESRAKLEALASEMSVVSKELSSMFPQILGNRSRFSLGPCRKVTRRSCHSPWNDDKYRRTGSLRGMSFSQS